MSRCFARALCARVNTKVHVFAPVTTCSFGSQFKTESVFPCLRTLTAVLLAACAGSHLTVLFSQKVLPAQQELTHTDLLCLAYFLFQD